LLSLSRSRFDDSWRKAWDYRYYIIIICVAIGIELVLRLQNSAFGMFGTEDEWTNYMRAFYFLRTFQFPSVEPMQIPHEPIVATPGPAILMSFLIEFFQKNNALLSYSGAVIGGLVFPAVYFACKSIFRNDQNRNVLSIVAVGLAILSAPLLIRMQLFVGETIAFVLLLLMIGLYATEKYSLSALLIFLIGFNEEFTTVIALATVLLTGILSAILCKNLKCLKWSLIITIVGIIPESILFIAQNPSYRTSFVSQGFFPYPNVLQNSFTIVDFLGVMLPLFGLLGFIFYLRETYREGLSNKRLTLIVWFSLSAIYSIFPPLLPQVTLFRTLDYFSLPSAILGALCLVTLMRSKNLWPLFFVSVFMIVSSSLYALVYHTSTLIGYLSSLGTELGNEGELSLILIGAFVATASFVMVFRKLPLGRSKSNFVALTFVLLLSMIIIQTTFYSSYEISFYQSYFNSAELHTISNLSTTLPKDSWIATNFVLGANVAALSNRTVKDLPPYITSAQSLLADIQNDSIYTEIFGTTGGVAPQQLRVPITTSVQIYLLVLEGQGFIYTNSTVMNELMNSSNFKFYLSSDRMFLFEVILT